MGRAGPRQVGSAVTGRPHVALDHHGEHLPSALRRARGPLDRAGLYVHIRGSALGVDPAAVVERGRQAGRDLGDDPAATVDRLVERVRSELAGTDDRLIEVIGGLGIRLHTYLQTRTFELAVHGLDIAGAAGIRFTLPDEVLGEATVLAARIATAIGEGQTVLLSLTGRTALRPSFSVV